MADSTPGWLAAVLLSAMEALLSLLNIMAVPAVMLIVFGALTWYRSAAYQTEERVRLGKMLVMFGVILLSIVLITTYFLSQMLQRKQAAF